MHRTQSWTCNATGRNSRQLGLIRPHEQAHPSEFLRPHARNTRISIQTRSAVASTQQEGAATYGLRLKKPRYYLPSICWERWELLMLQKEEEAEQEGSGADDEWDLTSLGSDAGQEERAASLYFSHWDDPAAHLPYLQDQALVSAFKQAIKGNAALLQGKTVLDLGCGPGHLAMMCAQAGASHVYAVDGSEGAAAVAKQVVLANGLSDKITVIHADVDDLQLREKVDVIVSDCLGPMLLGGGMMRALALAKKNLLKSGGLVLPDVAELFVAGIDDRDSLMSAKQQWQQQAGFDMSAAMPQVVRTPRLDTLSRSSQLFTDSCSLLRLDLGTQEGSLALRQAAASGFSAPFTLQAARDERLFALMLWFDASFMFGGQAAQPPVVFTSGPSTPATHQQQLLLNFPKSIRLAKGDTITGTISWQPAPGNHREVQVELDIDYKGVAATASYTLPGIMTHRTPDA